MLKKLWRSSFFYRKLEKFIEAKTERFLLEKVSENNLIEKRVKIDTRTQVWQMLQDLDIKKVTRQLNPNVQINHYTDSMLSGLIFQENFELDEIDFLQRFLKSNDIFVDIGSNIGLFSLLASPVVGEGGKVIAFEPSSQTHQRLLENIHLNNFTNCETHQLALSNSNDGAELHIASDGFDAWNSLTTPSQGSVLNTEKVKTTTLDNFMQAMSNSAAISLIKIDVEGWEIPVLEGGEKVLSQTNAPDLMVEFTDENAKNAGYSCTQLYHLLVQFGYELFTYDAKNIALNKEFLREAYPYLNIIATKNLEQLQNRIKNS